MMILAEKFWLPVVGGDILSLQFQPTDNRGSR